MEPLTVTAGFADGQGEAVGMEPLTVTAGFAGGQGEAVDMEPLTVTAGSGDGGEDATGVELLAESTEREESAEIFEVPEIVEKVAMASGIGQPTEGRLFS
jgi:uncharacterized spore protein YtfJ